MLFPFALSLRCPAAAAVAHYKPIKGVSRDSDAHMHICPTVCLSVRLCLAISHIHVRYYKKKVSLCGMIDEVAIWTLTWPIDRIRNRNRNGNRKC